MNPYVIMVPTIFLLGMLMGVFLSDNTKGFSLNELKLGALLFIVVNLFVLWLYPEMEILVWLNLMALWMVLAAGIILGERIKSKIIAYIIDRSVRKQDIECHVATFQQKAWQKDHLMTEINQILRQINQIKNHPLIVRNISLSRRLCAIEQSYVILSKLSLTKSSTNYGRLVKVAQDLSDVTIQVLKEVEKETEQTVNKKLWSSLMFIAQYKFNPNTISNTD